MEGLHSLPNMSFSSQVPATPGFAYKNNHHLVPGRGLQVREQCLHRLHPDRLASAWARWNQPGSRGNSLRVGSFHELRLAGAGDARVFLIPRRRPTTTSSAAWAGRAMSTPKAVPKRHLAHMVDLAYGLMKRSGPPRVFEIMDYSQGVMVEGNSDLTRDVVQRFLRRHARCHRLCQRLYPVSHLHSAGQTAADLLRLLPCARTQRRNRSRPISASWPASNQNRPYFLLMHVRQHSNIKKVKSILDRLGPEFKVVPLDVFLKMAGEQPTFQERFLEKE